MKKFLFSILCMAFAFTSEAQVLLNEDFDYGATAGDLTTLSGGNWTDHSGSGAVGYATTSLSMTGYPASGVGGAATILTASGEDVNRVFAAQTSGTVYMSALMNISAVGSGDYFFHFKDDGFDFSGRVGAQDDASGGINFGIGASSSTLEYGTTSYSLNTTYLVVASYNIDNGESNLYVLTAPVATEPSTPEATNTGTAGRTCSSAAFRQGSNTPDATIDGIRVALTWSDIMTASTADATVTLSAGEPEIAEDGSSSNISATLSTALTEDVTVNLTFGGTATSGTDYTTSSTSIVITAGNTSGFISVTSVVDTDEEATETVMITIDDIVSVANVEEDGVQQAVVNILDDDFVPSSLYISEVADPQDNSNARFVELYNAGATAIDFDTDTWFMVIQFNGGTLVPVQLTGSVAAGETYVIGKDSVDFNTAYGKDPNMENSSINGTGDDGYFLYKDGDQTSGLLKDIYGEAGVDGTDDPWEYLDGRAERNADVTQSSNVWTASEWTITRPATTGDMTPCLYGETTVTLGAVSTNLAEDGEVKVYATLSEVVATDVVVTLAYGGSAAVGSDYDAPASTITITAGDLADTITITAIDDTEIEAVETITIDVTDVTGAVESGNQAVSINIIDNDTPPVPLFFSEVSDPGDQFAGRFVELFNAGTETIDFDTETWFLVSQFNGGSTGSVQLKGSIAAGATFVIALDSTDFNGFYGFNPNMDAGIINGNGDDGYYLYKDGTEVDGELIDSYGEFGVDGTGEDWEYTNARAERNNTITQANVVWTASEWTITDADIADMDPGVFVPADVTAPTVEIQGAPTSVNTTAAFAVTFEFSEDVTGFEMADISVTNAAASNFVAVDANTYTADITPDANGDITIDVATAVAQDGAGNDNEAATQVSVSFDNTAPTVMIQNAPSIANATAFTVTFEFSEDVTGFEMADISVANATVSNFATTDANTYTADITADGNGAITIDVAASVAQDAAGNDNTAATQVSVTYDGTAPTATIALSTGADPLTSATFEITITFDEDVTGFALNDVLVTNGTPSNFQAVDAQTYTVDIETTTLGDAVAIVIGAGAATDAAGNDSEGATLSNVATDLEDDLAAKGVGVFAHQSTVTIQFTDAKSADAKVGIYNLNGQLVKEFKNQGQVNRNVKMADTGIFIVRVENHLGLTIKKVYIK